MLTNVRYVDNRRNFSEACTFVSGFDAATDGGLLDGFSPGSSIGPRATRPELAWMSLVFRHAFPSEHPSMRATTPEDDEVAIAALFSLLDDTSWPDSLRSVRSL